MILGEGRARERNILDKRVAEAHRQPPPSSAAVLVRRAPSHLAAVFAIIISCEVSKEKKMRGAHARCVGLPCAGGAAGPPRSNWGLRRATGDVRGREAAAQQPESRRQTLRGSSERSRPLHGLAALILRASAAFHALGSAAAALCFAPRRRYPANSRWARSPLNAENAPQTAALGLWSARTHRQGLINITRQLTCLVFSEFGALSQMFWRLWRPRKNRRAPRRTRRRVVSRLETVLGCRSSSGGS